MRLIRPKVIEEGDGYKIIRLPIWMSASMVEQSASDLRDDAAILGRTIKVTVGRRLMRIEGDVDE